MDCFIISAHTQVTKLEVQELIDKEVTCYEKVCFVKDISVQDLATLAYHAQSALRVCIHIGTGINEEKVSFTDLSYFNNQSFGVEHIKILDNPLPSTDFASSIGGQLQDASQSPVNLKFPDVKVISCNDEKIFVGIDVVGYDMGKRPYKLMAYPGSVSGAFAYCLLRLAGFKKGDILADPFCGSATIPIEAALFEQQISPSKFGKKLLGTTMFGEAFSSLDKSSKKKQTIFGFDHQVKVMLTAQKNAKIAGIHDALTISKVAIDWIDAKFDEHGVDIIVTNPPKINKRTNNKRQIEKLYDDLFYQGKYLLKQKGTLAMLLNHEDIALEMAKKHAFSHKKTLELYSGKQEYFFCIFQAP